MMFRPYGKNVARHGQQHDGDDDKTSHDNYEMFVTMNGNFKLTPTS